MPLQLIDRLVVQHSFTPAFKSQAQDVNAIAVSAWKDTPIAVCARKDTPQANLLPCPPLDNSQDRDFLSLPSSRLSPGRICTCLRQALCLAASARAKHPSLPILFMARPTFLRQGLVLMTCVTDVKGMASVNSLSGLFQAGVGFDDLCVGVSRARGAGRSGELQECELNMLNSIQVRCFRRELAMMTREGVNRAGRCDACMKRCRLITPACPPGPIAAYNPFEPSNLRNGDGTSVANCTTSK